MANSRFITTQAALALALTAAALAGGCRSEEQGRPLQLTPGVYKGERPVPLDETQRRALRDRGGLQG